MIISISGKINGSTYTVCSPTINRTVVCKRKTKRKTSAISRGNLNKGSVPLPNDSVRMAIGELSFRFNFNLVVFVFGGQICVDVSRGSFPRRIPAQRAIIINTPRQNFLIVS